MSGQGNKPVFGNRAGSVDFDESAIDRIFERVNRSDAPGAAVGIALEGKPIYRKAFGLASIELPVTLSPTMRMRIGSTTKHFTCLSYALLCEQGRASLDDPIGKFLPELDAAARAVSVRELMTHTSGLPDAIDVCMQINGTGRAVSTAELGGFYRGFEAVTAPAGTRWVYNNGTYVLLSLAIERIADAPLEEVFRRAIFDPVGLINTQLRRVDTDFLPNSATLHMCKVGGGFEKSYLGAESAGQGGIVSTVDDMLRWLAHMGAPTVGTTSTWELMKSPCVLTNGTSTGYGLGLMIDRYRGVETLAHAGGVMGGNSQMLKVPAAQLDVVVMVNRHDVSAVELANKILDTCLQDLEPARTQANPASVEGTYRSANTGRVLQWSSQNGQQIVSIDGFDFPVEFDEADGLWHPPPTLSYYKVTLELLEGARPQSVRLIEFGNVDELLETQRPAGSDVASVAGHYRSAAIKADVEIGPSLMSAQLVMRGQFGSLTYNLECLAERIWRAKSTIALPLGGILTFTQDAAEFYFRTARTLGLTFRRFN